MTDDEVIAVLDDFWRFSQDDKVTIWIGGAIQDIVNHHRERLGHERYGWGVDIETPYEDAFIPTREDA